MPHLDKVQRLRRAIWTGLIIKYSSKMGGDDEKVVRIPGETLLIKLSPDEEAYRQKYLPDPKKLTDEKLVCTVCSVSLAQNIHKGKDLYIHRALQVLVCEACYNFYGDGCFSADEDGDDKYCRWCGQGGTLYICSACNCAFCQKCTKQNLKASVLAELENDDWKCYICNPRPLFGCRTICWGAQQLNKLGKEKEQEKLKKVKERLEKLEAKKKEKDTNERKSRKVSSSEDEAPTKKRKRSSDRESSPEVMPKRKKRVSRNLNGNVGRRRKDSSSNSDSEEDKRPTRRSRSSNIKEKKVQSDSDDESDSKIKKEKLKNKKKKKADSDESSDSGKKKAKRRSVKKKDSSDDESSDEKYKKKKKQSVKKRDDSTDSSSDEKRKKKKLRKKKKSTSSEESSSETKKKNKKIAKKKAESSSDKSSDEDESSRSHKKIKSKPDKEEANKKQEIVDSDNDLKKSKKQITTDSEEVNNAYSAEDKLVKKRINLAILWLSTIVNDISELGTLISLRATKFNKRKINPENLKSYEDVLNCVSKIKQLITGVHSNYDHIEKTLESHLKPWRILTGLEDADNEKNVENGNTSLAGEEVVSKTNETVETHENNDKLNHTEINGTLEESKIEKNNEENKENLNNWSDDSDEQNETRALISKVNESLEKSQNEDQDFVSDEKNVEDNESNKNEEESKHMSDDNGSTEERINNASDSETSLVESKTLTPKKDISKTEDDEKVSSEESNKSDENNEAGTDSKKKSPKKSSPVKNDSVVDTSEDRSEEGGNEKEKESEGSKYDRPVRNDHRKLDLGQKTSSDEECPISSFGSRLKNKWLPENHAEEMNLKKTDEIDKMKGDREENPKVVLKKLKLEESVEESGIEASDISKKETQKKINQGKNKGKEKRENQSKCRRDESEDEDMKTSVKRKEEKPKSSSRKKEGKSNCLSSSDEEENQTIKTKRHSFKSDDKKKAKKSQSKGLSSEDEEEVKGDGNSHKKVDNIKSKSKENKIKHSNIDNDEDEGKKVKSKRKSDQISRRIKQEKNNCLSSEDEEEKSERKSKRSINEKKPAKQKEVKVDTSEDESKVTDPAIKSKEKGKIKRREEKNEEESGNENNCESDEDKLKSPLSGKIKSEEDTSDVESRKSKKIKLKKSKESRNSNEEKVDTNGKDEKLSESKKDCVELDSSDDERVDSAERSNDDSKNTAEESQTKMQKEVENDLNATEKVNDFSLELQASSTENTMDTDQEKTVNSGAEQMKNDQDNSKGVSNEKDEEDIKMEKTKFVGLDSSSDEEVKETKSQKKSPPKKTSARNQKKPKNVLVLSSDDEEVGTLAEPVQIDSSEEDDDMKDEKDGDYIEKVDSSAESNDSEILPKNKRKKKATSDSDDASVSDVETNKKKKRKRIKCADSSDESGDENVDNGQKNDGESPAKGGRKNIKKIKKKGDLQQTTIEAAEEEKERRRRIEERQKLFNQVFEIKESAKLEKLVLDFDPETKKELISVNKDLVAKMKPHQAKGVKFMWDSCFESVKQIKKTKGSGCILAHCMGLGKTFQVISLIHTLLSHEELTKVRTVMVVCPLSTVLNWYNEFGKWLEDVEGGDEIEVFHLTKYNKNPDRARELRRWQHNGGVLIMGYEMFRNLTNETTKKFKAKMKKDFLETLIDPGADLIVCDEGHMLKNEATALSKAMTRVKTLRRIVLTGTPMQNNLKEYHCMVQFVKPNLLGTSKEFLNRFVNPINNGQFVDSTDHDVKLMKRRAHVLHKMLEGLVQRFDYNVLTPFLPPKQEYVISVCLSELQEKLYAHYLENESQKSEGMKGGTRLFMDWQSLGRVWTHPRVLKMSTDKANWLKEKKAMEASDSEGSLRDFIDDDSDKSTTSVDSTDEGSSDEEKKTKARKVTHSRSTRSTRQRGNLTLLESSDEEKGENGEETVEDSSNKGAWWSEFVEPQHFEDMRQSGKLLLLFAILKECEMIEDKVLVFSQSLFSLDLIEYFLDKIDAATQAGKLDENLNNHQGAWSKGLDYFRLDGSTSSENRNIWCKSFNREDNPRARLFLISTRAGGLGINLTAANRVIIFDASWNPSHDIQSIFRIYRFGQKKPCYVYRFVAHGTMEEKVYERQVAKQSISNRVVDEQQVHRHFSMNDLQELYTFTPATKLEDRPTPALPRDPLMAEILSQMKQWIEKYHEHDSLLENVVEEELNEEERKAAWDDYENDKKRGFMPPTGPQGVQMNPNAAWNQQIEIMRQQLKLRYTNKSDEEINSILVYQVSILMRQQQQQQMQMAAQMQGAGNMGYRPQMYGNNMMGQMYNQRPQMQTQAYLRNIAPKPSSQQPAYTADQVFRMQQQANLARLQMQQLAQQKQQAAPSLQSLLGGQHRQPTTNYPSANIGEALNTKAAELQRMAQNYQSSRQNKPGVKITEIFEDEASKSSES